MRQRIVKLSGSYLNMKTISSRKNEKTVHLKKLGSDRAYRHRCGEFLCDGTKLFGEAVQFGAEIKTVFVCGETDIAFPDGAEVYSVSQDIMDYVSPMKNPQKLLFTCAIPQKKAEDLQKGSYIILENIQDPGNVGTVIRTAGAFGIDCVLLTGACADVYNPKTIRATMGAVFRQNVQESDFDGILKLKENGIKLYGAALMPDCESIEDTELENAAVVIGSEGQGLSREMIGICDKCVIIPMEPNCESLNAAAAAAIFMWEMRNKRKSSI